MAAAPSRATPVDGPVSRIHGAAVAQCTDGVGPVSGAAEDRGDHVVRAVAGERLLIGRRQDRERERFSVEDDAGGRGSIRDLVGDLVEHRVVPRSTDRQWLPTEPDRLPGSVDHRGLEVPARPGQVRGRTRHHGAVRTVLERDAECRGVVGQDLAEAIESEAADGDHRDRGVGVSSPCGCERRRSNGGGMLGDPEADEKSQMEVLSDPRLIRHAIGLLRDGRRGEDARRMAGCADNGTRLDRWRESVEPEGPIGQELGVETADEREGGAGQQPGVRKLPITPRPSDGVEHDRHQTTVPELRSGQEVGHDGGPAGARGQEVFPLVENGRQVLPPGPALPGECQRARVRPVGQTRGQ